MGLVDVAAADVVIFTDPQAYTLGHGLCLVSAAPSSSSSAACRGWCCWRVWQVRGCPSLESGEVRGPSPLQGLVLGQGTCTLQGPHEDHFRASIWRGLEGHGLLCVHIVRECVDMRFRSFCVAGAGQSHDPEVLVMLFQQELGRCGGSLRVRSDIAERAGLVW